MTAQPVSQALRPGRFAVNVVGGAKYRDKDLGRLDLPGITIDDRHGLTGIIHKQLVTGLMNLAH